MTIKRKGNSIFSINAVDMYPSIKFGMIEKAVYYFLRDASDADKEAVD